ncbi:sensor histidine kinase [Paenibacillus hexagrammi]|uniref:Histidine kinase n=1 Tax=Paenibacillus hexagrammi TaxID=2908839 RepID=A0ABY3SEM4_9BACL|nr:histidine kinase [Paenibacillus sp. YPD9-1]UJF31689.1 histidine kinase [Paenibacillus sp. YPD9-1]
MQKWYDSLSFHFRIQAAFVILIILAVSLAGGGAYWIASDIVESNAARSGQETMNTSKQVLDERMRHIVVSVMTLMFSDAFKGTIRDVSLGDSSQYPAHLSAMQPLFAQIKLNEPMAESVLISTPIGDFYDTAQVRSTSVKFNESDPYRRVQASKNNVWIAGHEDPFFSSHKRVVSLVIAPTLDVSDVYIIVNVLESSLRDVLRANLNQTNADMVLVTHEGSEVLESVPDLWKEVELNPRLASQIANGHIDPAMMKNQYIFNYAGLEVNKDWALVSIQKRSELLRQLNRIKWLTISVAAGCICVALLVSRMLMRFLLKPLQSLRIVMKRVENNDLTVRYESRSSDEFSRLGDRFNRMLDEISNLIEKNKQVEADRSKAEVKALQAQISPHFLYNTLNTIYWRNQMGQNGDVGDMVLALSRMFQLGLNGGNEMTTLEKELEHLEQYLHLQMKCYEELFAYEILVEEDSLLQIPVLKLMLQPLVENSILHGFKNKRSGGMIRVQVCAIKPHVVITVQDNGKGYVNGQVGERLETGTG